MDELVEHRTVLDGERGLVLEKRGGAQRLGFALVLKSCTRHGRFPRGRAGFSDEAVKFCILIRAVLHASGRRQLPEPPERTRHHLNLPGMIWP